MLAETDSAANRTIQYAYDAAGNMLSRTVCTSDTGEVQDTRTYAYDSNNRIGTTETSPYSYVHDANGNLTQENENVSVAYTYDGYNRIKSINKPGLPFLEYEYNQENLRTAKIESDSIPASAKTVYGYDKDGNLVLEKNAYNASDKTVYLWEDTGNAAIMKRGGKVYSYVYDGMGRIHALYDYDAAENTFTYDVYGYTAYGEPLYTVGNVENPFRYASYYYDTDTGLYYLKNRYYAANKARFLTEDTYWNVSNMLFGKFTSSAMRSVYYPAIVQSANRFAYCLNNPIGWYDPWGLVVTAWDKINCTSDELALLQELTEQWERGYRDNNQKMMDDAHAIAEAIRDNHRQERGLGEYGFDDGNTGVGDSKYSQDYWYEDLKFSPAPESLSVQNDSSDSFLDSIFGTNYSVTTTNKIETVSEWGLFELSSGRKVEVTVSEIGDSSKPILVYAKQNIDNPIVSSGAGIQVNIWDFSATLNFGLDDTRLSGSLNINDTSYAFHGIIDIANMKVGIEISDENTVASITSTTYENIKVDITTILEAVLTYYLGSKLPSKLPA